MSDGTERIFNRVWLSRLHPRITRTQADSFFKGRGSMALSEVVQRAYVPHSIVKMMRREPWFTWSGVIHCDFRFSSIWMFDDGVLKQSPCIITIDGDTWSPSRYRGLLGGSKIPQDMAKKRIDAIRKERIS